MSYPPNVTAFLRSRKHAAALLVGMIIMEAATRNSWYALAFAAAFEAPAAAVWQNKNAKLTTAALLILAAALTAIGIFRPNWG